MTRRPAARPAAMSPSASYLEGLGTGLLFAVRQMSMEAANRGCPADALLAAVMEGFDHGRVLRRERGLTCPEDEVSGMTDAQRLDLFLAFAPKEEPKGGLS